MRGADLEVRDFFEHLANERQLSSNTVKAYRLDLSQLIEFLDDLQALKHIEPGEVFLHESWASRSIKQLFLDKDTAEAFY